MKHSSMAHDAEFPRLAWKRSSDRQAASRAAAEDRSSLRPVRRLPGGLLLVLSVPAWVHAIAPGHVTHGLLEAALALGLFCLVCLIGTWLIDVESRMRGRAP